MKVASVYTRGKRGRPPLPLHKKIAGRVLEGLGGRKQIIWFLTEGGETRVSLVRDATNSFCSREWARVLINALGIATPRKHGLMWRIMSLFKHDRMNLEERKRQAAVARRFTNQRWITREAKKSGSFEKLVRESGFPEQMARRLHNILVGAGFCIPRKTAVPVSLECGQCGKLFHRSIRCHNRRLLLRKLPYSFCSLPCFHLFRKELLRKGEYGR